jgi:ammonia channel protein AmtB
MKKLILSFVICVTALACAVSAAEPGQSAGATIEQRVADLEAYVINGQRQSSVVTALLDTFGMHAVGGTLGALLTGLLASAEVNGNLNLNLEGLVGTTLWIEQLKAIALTLVLAILAVCAGRKDPHHTQREE